MASLFGVPFMDVFVGLFAGKVKAPADWEVVAEQVRCLPVGFDSFTLDFILTVSNYTEVQ